MRILLLADLHRDPEMLGKLDSSKYDLVVIAGDFGSEGYLEKILALGDNIYWVPGNMERLDICGDFPEKCLHMNKLGLEDGLSLVGFGFSAPTPFGTPGELSEEEIYSRMKGLPIDEKTILVTHTPPYGVLDDVEGVHAGSKSVKRIMEEKKPLVLACGHIHHKEGKEKVGETTVVNIPQGNRHRGVLLEIEKGRIHLDVEPL